MSHSPQPRSAAGGKAVSTERELPPSGPRNPRTPSFLPPPLPHPQQQPVGQPGEVAADDAGARCAGNKHPGFPRGAAGKGACSRMGLGASPVLPRPARRQGRSVLLLGVSGSRTGGPKAALPAKNRGSSPSGRMPARAFLAIPDRAQGGGVCVPCAGTKPQPACLASLPSRRPAESDFDEKAPPQNSGVGPPSYLTTVCPTCRRSAAAAPDQEQKDGQPSGRRLYARLPAGEAGRGRRDAHCVFLGPMCVL